MVYTNIYIYMIYIINRWLLLLLNIEYSYVIVGFIFLICFPTSGVPPVDTGKTEVGVGGLPFERSRGVGKDATWYVQRWMIGLDEMISINMSDDVGSAWFFYVFQFELMWKIMEHERFTRFFCSSLLHKIYALQFIQAQQYAFVMCILHIHIQISDLRLKRNKRIRFLM